MRLLREPRPDICADTDCNRAEALPAPDADLLIQRKVTLVATATTATRIHAAEAELSEADRGSHKRRYGRISGKISNRSAALPMTGSSPNPDAGRRLRAARQRLGLSTREVEALSRQLALKRENQEYYISHGWLSEMERGELTPGIYKLYTLSTIYQYRFDELLAFYGVNIGDLGLEQLRLPLPNTHLVGIPDAPMEIAAANIPGVHLDKTDLVSRMFSGFQGLETDLFPGAQSGPSVYGYVGTKDFTLFPLIRPGSFVQIDSSQRKVERAGWSSLFERPIYFVELRNEYACSWCEEKGEDLLLIPHPQSGKPVRAVRHPDQAEVLGRVTAVTMRIAGPRGNPAEPVSRS
jgi:transcriptional regulator with XRE-family HTH domain